MRVNMRFVAIGEVVAEKCPSAISTRFTMVKTPVFTMVNGEVVFLSNYFTNHNKPHIGTHLLVNASTIA